MTSSSLFYERFFNTVELSTGKLRLEGVPGPGQGLCCWPLQALLGEERGKFQTLWSLGRGKFQALCPLAARLRGRARRRARAPQEPQGIQRFFCIA